MRGYKNIVKTSLLSLLLLAGASFLFSQPILSGKRTIDGIEIYPDFKNKNLFYFAPKPLALGEEAGGKPKFQLVQMRYTGTACYGDQGDKRFLNLVQFSVQMAAFTPAEINLVKQKIKGKRRSMPILKPLPIQNIESFLVSPIGKDDEGHIRHQKVGTGSLQAGSSENQGAFWTERTFTLQLENYEAQLLWQQVETGKLALSFGYAFYANVMRGDSAQAMVSGNMDNVEDLEELIEEVKFASEEDTLLMPRVVYANAFPINLDPTQWPESMRKIDINEGMPPAYPALEIKCFDFSDDLRPDLALKKIDIEAFGVSGKLLRPVSVRFSRGQADANSLQVYFPYAVDMNREMRYRITEFSQSGERTISDWRTKDICSYLVDITTPFDQNEIGKFTVEVELEPESFQADSIKEIIFKANFILGEKILHQDMKIRVNSSLPIGELSFRYQKDQPISYTLYALKENGDLIQGKTYDLREDYYYLSSFD